MRRNEFIILISGLLFACSPQIKEEQTEIVSDARVESESLTLPSGFNAQVVADSIGRGRHITIRENGDIYVKLHRVRDDGTSIAALRDTDGDTRADEIEYFGEFKGTGIQIFNNYLYFSSDSAIYRYALDDNLVPQTERETVVSDLPNQTSHAAKPITFDEKGNLYVNVGAPSNACMEQARTKGSPGQNPCPLLERQGSIWRFPNKTNMKQMTDGYQYSVGIRNVVALEWNAASGDLYGVMHGRDQLDGMFPDLFDSADNAELPAEEFFKFVDGGNFGWPYCFFNAVDQKKVKMPEFGGDGTIVGDCADVEQPLIGFPGHIAPNDLLFYSGDQFPEKYKNGAFIAFHGSWNRAPLPQKGYFVVFVPMADGMPSGDWEIFADLFGGDPGEVIKAPGDAEYRPTGLAQGPDGSLYIVDSVKGKIWKISYSVSA